MRKKDDDRLEARAICAGQRLSRHRWSGRRQRMNWPALVLALVAAAPMHALMWVTLKPFEKQRRRFLRRRR